jgi:histidine triad (HIT) family protein
MNSDECLFCRIASGALSSNVVYESTDVVAFLDINPIRPGHVQIVPRKHFPYYDDIPARVAGEIMFLGQRLAPVLRRLFRSQRVAFLYTGADIAHAHAHVVPMQELTDITSRQYIFEQAITFRQAPRAPETELQHSALLIVSGLREANSDA